LHKIFSTMISRIVAMGAFYDQMLDTGDLMLAIQESA
jgi:hypothetical protein